MIVYTKVLIAAINLMKMTGPIKAEMKVLDVIQSTGNTWVVVPGKIARQSKGRQSLFWNSRKGHALVQVDYAESVEDRIALRVIRVYGSEIPSPGGSVSLSGWLGEHPEHFGLKGNFEEIVMPNQTRAWHFPAPSDKWVIHVHGRRAGMGETLRNVEQFANLGFRQLTISMESDPKPFGLGKAKSNLGETEWDQVELAVLHAQSEGAKEILLFGWSQGSFMIGQFLRNSKHVGKVRGAIFDSPLLDYRSTMQFHAKRAGLARRLGDRVIDAIQDSEIVKLLGYRNVDVDGIALNNKPVGVNIPFLILYSSTDGHVESFDVHLFAGHNQDVTLVEIEGAKHCRLYNHDQEKYQNSISQWLRQHQI
jgi:alpha-beta hydrolase superfamily lysophospholipase